MRFEEVVDEVARPLGAHERSSFGLHLRKEPLHMGP